jgi:hypothetical protein
MIWSDGESIFWSDGCMTWSLEWLVGKFINFKSVFGCKELVFGKDKSAGQGCQRLKANGALLFCTITRLIVWWQANLRPVRLAYKFFSQKSEQTSTSQTKRLLVCWANNTSLFSDLAKEANTTYQLCGMLFRRTMAEH